MIGETIMMTTMSQVMKSNSSKGPQDFPTVNVNELAVQRDTLSSSLPAAHNAQGEEGKNPASSSAATSGGSPGGLHNTTLMQDGWQLRPL